MAPKHGSMNMESVLSTLDNLNTGRNRFSPKEEGEYIISILPPAPNKEQFFELFGLHYKISQLPGFEDLADRRSILCHKITWNQPCLVDKVVSTLYNQARAMENPRQSKTLASIAGGSLGRKRFVVNVVCHDQIKRGVLTWEFKEDIANQFAPLLRRFGDFVTPGQPKRQALAVTFKKQGEWITPTNIIPTGDYSDIPVTDWADQLHDLDEYIKQYEVPQSELRDMYERATEVRTQVVVPDTVTAGPDLDEQETTAAETEETPDDIESALSAALNN